MARELIRPCAACKHLGQMCDSSCDLAPYFPADNPQRYNLVHTVFGRRNVSKILQEIDVSHREQAADALVYEAEARVRDPIYGCAGLTSILEQRLKEVQENLRNVKNELTKYLSPEIIQFVLSNPDLFGLAPDNYQNPHVSQYQAQSNVSPPTMTVGGGQLAISEPQLSTVQLKALQTHNLELLKQRARSGPNGGGLTVLLPPGHFPFRDVVLPSSGLNAFENCSTSITSDMGFNPISGGLVSCSDGGLAGFQMGDADVPVDVPFHDLVFPSSGFDTSDNGSTSSSNYQDQVQLQGGQQHLPTEPQFVRVSRRRLK